jgi:hypothetical protein
MRKETLESILLLIGVIAPAAAFVVFWVGKLLNLRKEIIELQMNQQFDRQRIVNLEKDIEQLQEWYNRGRNN